MAKRFFYVCAGLLMLALSYHLGASTATAQAPSNPVVGIAWIDAQSTAVVTTAGGDVYKFNGAAWAPFGGNVFGGSTATHQTSWGALKVQTR